MSGLGRVGFQKCPPHRNVEEEVAYLHDGARRAAAALDGAGDPRLDHDFRSFGGVGLARLAADPGDLGNRRQRLAAEPEGADPAQVLNVRQLAGRVGLKRQDQVVGGHPQAVVGDPDQIFTPALDAHVNPRRTRVNGVFEQLLDHARRPLHHLARGDLVHYRLRQLTDHSHPTSLLSSLRNHLSFYHADLAYRKRRP